ncbi:hypothetical protein F3D3_2234 [Fusibacter sp. 3D3]|nr:hypothetical protein F3D3_2234 [Fusibacter sp. 3D3]
MILEVSDHKKTLKAEYFIEPPYQATISHELFNGEWSSEKLTY